MIMNFRTSICLLLLVLLTSPGTAPAFADGKAKGKAKTTTTQQTQPVKQTLKDDGEYHYGHKIMTGPRGGKYYVNGNGKKVYIKK